jgi:hypothetical protein
VGKGSICLPLQPIDQIWSDSQRHWTLGTQPPGISPLAAIDPILNQVYIGVLAKLTLEIPQYVGVTIPHTWTAPGFQVFGSWCLRG